MPARVRGIPRQAEGRERAARDTVAGAVRPG
jgi:hypothetical protein